MKIFGQECLTTSLPKLRVLRDLGIYPKTKPEHWKKPYRNDDKNWIEDGDVPTWHYIAFEIPKTLLLDYIWFPTVLDFGSFKPRIDAQFYFFNQRKKVLAYPYDDRGMDVISPNIEFLKKLYIAHYADLHEYDLERIRKKFFE